MKSVLGLQNAAERADNGNLETVQDPGNSKRHHDHEVEARPRESVQPRGHRRLDKATGVHASNGHALILFTKVQEGNAALVGVSLASVTF